MFTNSISNLLGIRYIINIKFINIEYMGISIRLKIKESKFAVLKKYRLIGNKNICIIKLFSIILFIFKNNMANNDR